MREDSPTTETTDRGSAPGSARAHAKPLLEEGAAFMQLSGLAAGRAQRGASERLDVIVIGGGQAGLSVGYQLKQRGLRFVILDASTRIGDSWRARWDSLRLFSPARYDGLAGMAFPAPAESFPTKDQMADYLETYAKRFALPVRSGIKVEKLTRRDGRYLVRAGEFEFEADHVVVAMSGYQTPQTPAFAEQLDPAIVQLHSSDYRNPAQLKPGAVLLVGAGNSGAEIAFELVRQRPVLLAGHIGGHVPFRIASVLGRKLLVRLVFSFFHWVLTLSTPIGRKARPQMLARGIPLIRVLPQDLSSAGVTRLPRVAGVRDGRPVLEDGRSLDVANVVFCTGFSSAYRFIGLPVFDDDGKPLHERGVVTSEHGLYFVGMHFQYAMSSGMIQGVSRDAAHVAAAIVARKHATVAA